MLAGMMLRLLLALLLLASGLMAQENPDWTTNHEPFRISDNLYYVGSKDLASYLIVTPAGDILINSNLESSVPQIRANVEKLGFHMGDIKVLLISHAHSDHDAGSAGILKLTHAKYEVMQEDVATVESGGASDPAYGKSKPDYPPTHVDRVLHDGDTVELGGAVLTAHRTPGHTPGCTTWTMKVTDHGKTYNVVIVGSPNVNSGYKLIHNAKYPGIAEDYVQTFRVLHSLPCDIFLGAHGQYFDMLEKLARKTAPGTNPFVDPQGYKTYVAEREQAFQEELAKQKK